MRCSSCEALLDRYVEGALKPRQMADVTAHVRGCSNCRALIEELKVVDALLVTTRTPELAENFTFAVMADVQALPAPRAREHPFWSFLALYSAAAWVATIAGMALTGTTPNAVLTLVAMGLSRAGVVSGSFAANVSHGLSHTFPSLAAFGIGVLLVDIAIAGAFALLYFVVRPRLAAQLAPSREAAS